jgi:hypothetical protein
MGVAIVMVVPNVEVCDVVFWANIACQLGDGPNADIVLHLIHCIIQCLMIAFIHFSCVQEEFDVLAQRLRASGQGVNLRVL